MSAEPLGTVVVDEHVLPIIATRLDAPRRVRAAHRPVPAVRPTDSGRQHSVAHPPDTPKITPE